MAQLSAPSSKELTELIVKAIDDRKGLEIVSLDLRKLPGAVADFFVIASGTSDRHVQAVSNSVVDALRDEFKEKPSHIEGFPQGQWILLDYINVVVHVFQEEQRKFFALEDLWGDGVKKVHEFAPAK